MNTVPFDKGAKPREEMEWQLIYPPNFHPDLSVKVSVGQPNFENATSIITDWRARMATAAIPSLACDLSKPENKQANTGVENAIQLPQKSFLPASYCDQSSTSF